MFVLSMDFGYCIFFTNDTDSKNSPNIIHLQRDSHRLTSYRNRSTRWFVENEEKNENQNENVYDN